METVLFLSHLVSDGEYYTFRSKPFNLVDRQPQRILTYLKQSYPEKVYEQAFLSFFYYLWAAEPQLDLSKQENVIHALQQTSLDGQGSKLAFSPEEIRSIMQESSSEPIKEQLKVTTERCWKELGAYGCPWFWVINDEKQASSQAGGGESNKEEGRWAKLPSNPERPGEPFFGSDRWHFMWDYLGIPWQDVKILSPFAEASSWSKELLAKI